MIESVMLWNELNNVAHWHGGERPADDRPIEDPDFAVGFRMVADAARAVGERFPGMERVFPGLSPMDPRFLERAHAHGALEPFDALAGHNFWLDFGPSSRAGESGLERLAPSARALQRAARELTGRDYPFIFSEVGVSSFAGDQIQAWASRRTLAELDAFLDDDPSARVTWYSLFDLPDEYLVTSRYRPESHGETRHRKFGLYRHCNGGFRPKAAAEAFAGRRHRDRIGITQWFRMPWPDPALGIDDDHARALSYARLEAAPPLLRELGVELVRVNITWCDWHCAAAGERIDDFDWFDDLIAALSEFRLLVTIFQTPPQLARDRDTYAAGSVPRPGEEDGFTRSVLEILERYVGQPLGQGLSSPRRASG